MATAQTLLQYIAAHEGVRGIELADEHDMDIEVVERLLAPYIGTEVDAVEVIVAGCKKAYEYRMAKKTQKPVDQIDLAISYIRQHGPTLASELAGPMGLSHLQAPTPMLMAAVSAGRITRHGALFDLAGVPKKKSQRRNVSPDERRLGSSMLRAGRTPGGKLVIMRGKVKLLLSGPEERMLVSLVQGGAA